MKSDQHRDAEASPADAAAAWVVRCDRGLTATERQRFERWKQADSRHLIELERLNGAWRGLDRIRAVAELEDMADDFLAQARARRSRRRIQRYSTVMFGAAAALAVGFAVWRALDPVIPETIRPHGDYRVLASTLRQVYLPDGSVAELNGESRIEVDYTPTERRVRLTEGEAHFVVATNSDRPFFVTAGPVTVRAVGTAFNVLLAPAAVEVLVTEGKVKLESAERVAPAVDAVPAASAANPALAAGQRAVIDRAHRGLPTAIAIGELGRTEIDEALGWQSTRLEFNATRLPDVVEAFNRHNRRQLSIGDPVLRERKLTGVFRADNLDGFIRLLKASIDVKAEVRTPVETVLLPAR